MKDVLWLGAIALLAAPGLVIARMPLVARMPRWSRIALAFPAGVFIAVLLMYGYALAGIAWTRVNLFIPLGAIAVGNAIFTRPLARVDSVRWPGRQVATISAFIALAVYAIADARATCGDLMYIWAPKAEAFFHARTIDVQWLSLFFHELMHPDYPPLVPLTYNIGSIMTHRFSWWGALFLTPLILGSVAGALRGFEVPPNASMLVMAVLSFAAVSAYLPGGADPLLILFEAVALIALTFQVDSRDGRWIAACALAAAAFTKVEGLTFVIIVAIALILTQFNFRVWLVITPAAVLAGSWLLFAKHHQLLDQYARAKSPIYWNQLSNVLSWMTDRASYHAGWLPWIAAMAPLLAARSWRRAAFPLLVAAGSIASTIFFYLHDPNATLWIVTSADRILTTPLLCIALGSAATWERGSVDRLQSV